MSILKKSQPYASPQNGVAIVHLVISVVFYFGGIAIGTLFWGNWAALAIGCVLFTSGTIRFFGAQHDCGHYAHFTNRTASEVVGVILGAFTANPFFVMKYNHNRHHAEIGNLDEREAHEVLTWTVREYQAADVWQRLGYRLYRSAFVIYFVGPIFMFFIRYRLPKNFRRTGLLDIFMQNALMATLWIGVYVVGGPTAFTVFLMYNVFAACFGTFMVYAGHNFEEAYWEAAEDVDYGEAALRGSSVLDFGDWFHFLTFNFAYHDLHHYCVKIPAYRLKACHEALADDIQPTKLGWGEAVTSIRWKLWDEDAKRMVRFADVPQAQIMQPAE